LREIFFGNAWDEVLAVLIASITVIGSLLAIFTFGSSDQTVAFINIIGGLIILLFPIMKAFMRESFGRGELLTLTCALVFLFVGGLYIAAPGPTQTIEIQPVVPDDVV